jgi:hypothetical protein
MLSNLILLPSLLISFKKKDNWLVLN